MTPRSWPRFPSRSGGSHSVPSRFGLETSIPLLGRLANLQSSTLVNGKQWRMPLNVLPQKPPRRMARITYSTLWCDKQALQNRLWDLWFNSKNPYKGKIQAFGAKLGLFWDHFWTFLGLCRHFHENEKNMQKTLCHDVSHIKIYLTVSRYERAREYQRHDTWYMIHDTWI